MANNVIERRVDTPARITGDSVLFIISLLVGACIVAMVGALLVVVPALTGLGTRMTWHLSRATATVGYLLLTGSMIWGLVLSSKIIKEATPAPLVLSLHNYISWLGLVFGGLHAFLLLFDNYYTYRLVDLLVPFIGPYRPVAVGLGVVGMYLTAITTITFAWRSWLGQKNWRALHYLTFPAYILVTLHGLLAGTDSAFAGMRYLFIGSAALVLFLTFYRILTAGTRKRPAHAH